MELMPGYKRSDVGVIPDDWDAVPLSQTAKRITRGASPRPIDSPVWFDSRSSTGWVRISDVTRSGRYLMETTQRLSEEGIRRSRPVPSGSLIMSICATVGRPIETRIDTCIHDGFVVFDQPIIDQSYLYHVLAALEPTWSKHGQTGSQMNLNTGLINGCLIPLPSTETEQRAIAQALSDVDALLATLDQVIAKKRDLKQAAMQQLLTGKTRLPGFSGEWEVSQVQDVIATYFCGPSPTCEERNIQDDEEWGVLKTTAATKENGWDWTKHKTLPQVFWNKPQIELKKGDVIVTKAGPRHRVGVTAWIDYVPPRIIPSGKMIALRPNTNKVVPLMLAAAVAARDAQTYLDQRTTGMAESQVNFENIALLETPITIPRIEEQTAIAEVLTEMNLELAAMEQRRDKARALKQAMMQELLTGKTRLV